MIKGGAGSVIRLVEISRAFESTWKANKWGDTSCSLALPTRDSQQLSHLSYLPLFTFPPLSTGRGSTWRLLFSPLCPVSRSREKIAKNRDPRGGRRHILDALPLLPDNRLLLLYTYICTCIYIPYRTWTKFVNVALLR